MPEAACDCKLRVMVFSMPRNGKKSLTGSTI
jgi:hypothetical protein